MEQHPIPQHIAAFEFKLFGNLTVRQFTTLAIPLSIATLIYFSNLPTAIRFPLVSVFAVTGFIAALVPIQGRPLDKWIVAFIKAILSPTQRVWVKESKLPEFLSVVVNPSPPQEKIPEEITQKNRQRLEAYLRSLPHGQFTPLDVKEQIALQRLDFGQVFPSTVPSPSLPVIWPTQPLTGPTPYGARVPKLGPESSLPQILTVPSLPLSKQSPAQTEYSKSMQAALPPLTLPTSAKIPPHPQPFALPALERKPQPQVEEPLELIPTVLAPPQGQTPKAHLASELNFSIENIIPIKTPNKELKLIPQVGQTRVRKLHFAPPDGFNLDNLPVRGERKFAISEEFKKRFPLQESPPVILPAQENNLQRPKATADQESIVKASQTIPEDIHFVPKPTPQSQPAQKVSFKPKKPEVTDQRIAITGQKMAPSPLSATITHKAQIVPLTDKPNVLSGIVAGVDANPIAGAILTVRDQHGIPVRALKTNKLGQFLSVTSLPDGKYTIEVETDLATFPTIVMNLEGHVQEPMEIKAKSSQNT